MISRLLAVALVIGLSPLPSAHAIEVVNNSSHAVWVCLHRQISENVGAGFDLYAYYWQSEGWWSVAPGKSLPLPDGLKNCWMRMTWDSPNGVVIRPGSPSGGPASLIVHSKRFQIRRMEEGKDRWDVRIDGKLVSSGGRSAADAVAKHGCWEAAGFYSYRPNTKFTVTGGPPAGPPGGGPMPAVGGGPDPTRIATAGTITLKAGFEPDPHVKSLIAGGELKVNKGGVQAYVAKAPDFQVNYTAGDYPLTFLAESMADTTLLIRLPDGTWLANDDFNVLNPRIRIESPKTGRYLIWVGTIGPDTAPARLKITERD